MLSINNQVDDRVALWIEGDRTDARPVPGAARPARWIALPGLDVQGVASSEGGFILPGVALLWADVPDAAV